ncbi:hypothetical protein NDU88_001295 [Pleurodeles waltl]|uniref:Uncharacterized protein n=1 Tax=Pleurodeles waltl TaxID=8319 RepID=A0AAV7KP54_PLEWA|nr:hypothetical protein NDU88_001295 [Pleurodeles waltl]
MTASRAIVPAEGRRFRIVTPLFIPLLSSQGPVTWRERGLRLEALHRCSFGKTSLLCPVRIPEADNKANVVSALNQT